MNASLNKISDPGTQFIEFLIYKIVLTKLILSVGSHETEEERKGRKSREGEKGGILAQLRGMKQESHVFAPSDPHSENPWVLSP